MRFYLRVLNNADKTRQNSRQQIVFRLCSVLNYQEKKRQTGLPRYSADLVTDQGDSHSENVSVAIIIIITIIDIFKVA